MRTFVAIDIPDDIRQKIAAYMEGLRRFAPEVRWVSPESLHVTLKFIGEIPPERAGDVTGALKKIDGEQFDISFRDTGFFPNPRAPRVFWVGVVADARLERLAAAVDQSLVALPALKLEMEKGPYRPHLTLARSGSGRPRSRPGDRPSGSLQALGEKLSGLGPPDFGTMTAREFFLYESKLSPHGARYTRLEGFRLG